MTIIWSPEALVDLEDAVDYVRTHNPEAAAALVLAVTARIETLASEPSDGPEHVLRDGARARGWPMRPFRIFYQRTTDALLVVRIYHQRREPITR